METAKKTQQPQYHQYHRLNLTWAISILSILMLLDIWGGYQLLGRNLWVRIIKVKSLQSIQVKPVKVYDDYRQKVVRQSWSQNQDPMRQSVQALQWTMNQVQKVGYNPQGDDPVALLKSVGAGKGALCGDMADLYRHVLAVIGRPSRKIWLYRDLFSRDSHATVEVFLNGKWVLISPTFGVYFTNSQGEILSAQELKTALFTGKECNIQPVFCDERSYPPQMKDYYLNYLLLYNNVFVVERPSNYLAQIPPFCFWFGTKLYYERSSTESDAQVGFLQQIYLIFAVVIPVSILVFIGYIGYYTGWKRKRLKK